MSNSETNQPSGSAVAKYYIMATVVALIGLADSAYLTSKHISGSQVPCSITGGCEQVLTSSYSEIFGVPTAALGVLAYLAAFSLALLTYFGNRQLWNLFGVAAVLMAGFSLWFVYLQAFVIGAFCQFCLLSAITSISLFAIFISSKIFPSR